mgnify:CR=1 FL=1
MQEELSLLRTLKDVDSQLINVLREYGPKNMDIQKVYNTV